LRGKNEKATWVICAEPFGVVGIKRDTKGEELKKENFAWRNKALSQKMDLEQLVVVLQKINGQISGSSGYLGAISDRSKELYFNKQTVGQYLMEQLDENPNISLKNQVFYRQDYLDEFNTIWDKQAEYHKELTGELKQEIRDVVIFYQRRLKSQKGLINFCEFESRKIEVEVDGKKKTKTVGNRVIPRSSPLFQEFKIWQVLNNIEVSGKGKKSKKEKDSMPSLFAVQEDPLQVYGKRELYQEEKELLAAELSIKKELKKNDILKLLFDNPQELDLNFPSVQGNLTQATLFNAYKQIIEQSGHDIDVEKKTVTQIQESVKEIFEGLGIDADILQYSFPEETIKANKKGEDVALYQECKMYKLWQLLYSFEGDNTPIGNGNLINKITELYGFEKEYATILANVTFQDDYGSLSAKAIRKILPHLKEGNKYDVACVLAGYGKHSKSSLTKEEIENKDLRDKLDNLPKNSLRNPVVEKILNQMINVVNAIIADPQLGKPDEIRIELARELKKNAKEREELTKSISETTRLHDEYRKILSQSPFNLSYISRNDIIRYKLYEELKDNGYKTLYSNTYIPQEEVFSKKFDIEHIIPQSRLFDDSFSNKTLELRSANIEKGNKTAYDYVKGKYGEDGLEEYLKRIEALFKDKKTKLKKLKMQESDIPDGFIERDIRDTQYIAKKAKTILEELVRRVVSTSGSVTGRLREDWQLIDVMKELNWDKYNKLGLTYYEENHEGKQLKRIKDWTKRNDHRHHAMDALTVAFTKDAFIQLFNNMNASLIPNSNEYALKSLYIENGNVKPPMPLPEFRTEAKKHLENILISIKSKTKVVTQNINTTKKPGGTNKKVQLTPRGQLHNETIYGSYQKPVVKVNKKTGKKEVSFETVYTIRKEVSPDLKIDKVVDKKIQEILQLRLNKYGGDAKKAFSNLEENPIWLKEGKGIRIKRVTISGISNAESLHDKRDKEGNLILDKNGKKQPVDFVNTGNNHHVAIYRVLARDKKGNYVFDERGNRKYELQEKVVSFYEAVTRKNLGQPIIDKDYKKSEGWEFLFSMKQNEYFVFPNEKTGFDPQDIDLMNPENYSLISPNLFRIRKIQSGEYVFQHHLETKAVDLSARNPLKNIAFYIIYSPNNLKNIVKVRVNHIGQIVSVGEY
jgi:CRISPR-associated endonuclease Csn1